MNTKTFFLLLLAIVLGVFAALITWTLIVKSQVQSQLAASPSTADALSLLSKL